MIAVRVLHQGVIVREHVLPGLPVRVGRGPENDLVLFDSSVSRAHAVIESDASGELVVRDLGSRNAVRLGPRPVTEAHGGRVVRCLLGRVEIEVERLGTEDTLELRPSDLAGFEQRRSIADHARYVALAAAAWLAMVVGGPGLWSPSQQNRTGVILGHCLAAMVTLPVAGLVLLGFLRLAGRRVRIADTLCAFAVVALVFAGSRAVLTAAYYALPSDAFAMVKDILEIGLTVWAVVHLAALRRAGRSVWFRVAWGGATVVLIAGLEVLGTLTQRRLGMPEVNHHVQPPLASVTGPHRSLGTYFDRLAEASNIAAERAAEVNAKHSAARVARARASATAGPGGPPAN
ncbi:MAG TPA: FHA domain-containing protein [Vicinamibacteria bacterium]|nr:FHA domain-containing protein [Vicinamibacteria bacterium]